MPMTKEHRKIYEREYNQRPEVKAKKREYQKHYRQKHPEQAKIYHKNYYETHKEEVHLKGMAYRIKNKKKIQEMRSKYKEKYRDVINAKIREHHKKTRWQLKTEIINHYSNGTMQCACCGEKHIEFLSINHINGGGNKHRREIGMSGGGVTFYRWLAKNNFPEGFNVLCYNCNLSLGHCGYCPHQREKL